VKSHVDLSKVINTGKFNFKDAQSNLKWLTQPRYDLNPETEEYGVSSFLYQRDRPFNPHRLYDFFKSNLFYFEQTPHNHEVDHGTDADALDVNDEDWEDCDDDYEPEETEEQYQKRLAEAQRRFRKSREEAQKNKQNGVLKHVFRSKGFVWLSHNPHAFYEWSQAAVQQTI